MYAHHCISNNSVSLTVHDNPWSAWCVSADASAARALAIVSCLRALGHLEGSHFRNVSVHTLTNSGRCNGRCKHCRSILCQFSISGTWCQLPASKPSIFSSMVVWNFQYVFKSSSWLYTYQMVVELRSAARILFDAGIANLSIEETMTLVERWQHHCRSLVCMIYSIIYSDIIFSVPSLQPDAERKLPAVAMALFLCGYIAADKYSLLSPRLHFFLLGDWLAHGYSALSTISRSLSYCTSMMRTCLTNF